MKTIKKCLMVLLMLGLIAGALAACGEEPDTTGSTQSTAAPTTSTPSVEEPPVEVDTYVFTVIYGDTKEPVEGVMVQLCNDKSCLMPATTDENGKAEYSLGNFEYGVFDIHIMSVEDGGFIPEGYSFDNTAFKTNATDTEYTLELVKE